MLVGEGWALDSAQEETRLGLRPALRCPTYSVSPEFANAPLMYQPVPNPADVYPGRLGGPDRRGCSPTRSRRRR